MDRSFDATGMYNHHVVAHMRVLTGSPALKFELNVITNNEDTMLPNPSIECSEPPTPQILLYSHQSKPTSPNLDELRSKFGWTPPDIIGRTPSATTQFVRQITRTNGMRQHFRSRFPALNVRRRQNAVATNTSYSDTPAIQDGSTRVQLFVGHKSLVADVYGINLDKEYINTLEGQIRSRGATDSLLSSDRAQVEISKKVAVVLRAYHISDWHSEPLHQHQNPCETRYRTIKAYTTPAYCWLLCLVHVCLLFHHMTPAVLKYCTPLEGCTGITPDISALLEHTSYEPVYYPSADSHLPSSSNEKIGHFVDIAVSVGDALTHKILTDDTKKINFRSASPGAGESKPIIFVRSAHHDEQYTRTTPLPNYDPDDLIGRTFFRPMGNGEHHRATVIRKVIDNSDSNDIEDPKLDKKKKKQMKL
jgi:hypothetical protein